VWSQTSQKGYYDSFTQSANGVDAILGAADGSGQAGLQGSLAGLFQSFNQLRQGATEPINQENVIERARAFAITLSQTADFLGDGISMAQQRLQVTVEQVNGFIKGIQQWNAQMNLGAEPDPMSEAKIYASLEKLSALVPMTVQKDSNGGLTILLNGQTPLLQGTVVSPISIGYEAPSTGAPFPNASARIQILNSAGENITDSLKTGELGGLLDYVNQFVPKLMGDSDQQGDLNRMAQGVADSVNTAIGGSTPLFLYDPNPTYAARTLRLNPDFSRLDLVSAINATPVALANLTEIASGASTANQIDGQSYSGFFVSLSTRTSTALGTAISGLGMQAGLVEQARGFREARQGASVEESAVALLEFQRAFEASAKLIGVIDELTKMTIDLVR
jgi:flagellar hook-associated protein 1 FlgK